MGTRGIAHRDPWPHVEFDAFLPPAMAQAISDDWPADGFEWLRHSDIRQPDGTALRKFQHLERRFPEASTLLKSSIIETEFRNLTQVDDRPLFPIALLVEDLPGYWIRRHTDCAGKVISAQVYLPDRQSDESMGVKFHDRLGGSQKQIPYRFNHGYAFKVTGGSWHRVTKCDAPRRSLQLIFYSTPNPVI